VISQDTASNVITTAVARIKKKIPTYSPSHINAVRLGGGAFSCKVFQCGSLVRITISEVTS
jgi:hypothetical protein